MQTGNIGVTTENIFPVIKKFLYSDHEIFLREMISNAVDATQKLKTLVQRGDVDAETADLMVSVSIDSDNGTLTISDRGIGMTADEIDKYINQIAFSGVNDFLDKYKDNANAIIGHFGLGFYSAFMVSKQVDIISLSCQQGAQAVKWTCDGSPTFTIDQCDKTERGTDVVLHIDDDCKEFLDKHKIQQLLEKYCKFMPVPIAFGKKTQWKDGKEQDTDQDNIINTTEPLWTKAPSTLNDDDYKTFYRALYPMTDEPLFHIHLNVDYPFNLTGILYFPRIKNNIDLQRNKIQLYCNQVFVTDQVEGIVPDFLTLLHGVIDSPDIPLNVSRSYLQSDRDVKKISSYITRKVADRLAQLFKDDRNGYEKKWDDLKIFIHYGMLSQDDFYDRAKDFALLKDIDGKYFTYDEYKTLITTNQTDKDGNVVYLYATDTEKQFPAINTATQKGYSVLVMDGQLDTPMVSLLEQKADKCRFTRVDSDTIDQLIRKDDNKQDDLEPSLRESLTMVFSSQLPHTDKAEFYVTTHSMGDNAMPVVVTQSEYMRRMKDMSRYQPGMSFYAEMPDSYNLVLNTEHKLIKNVIDDLTLHADTDGVGADSDRAHGIAQTLAPIDRQIKALQDEADTMRKQQKDAKPEDISQEQKDKLSQTEKDIEQQRQVKKDAVSNYAKANKHVRQLIDIALLRAGLLTGEQLDNFLQRSVDMM